MALLWVWKMEVHVRWPWSGTLSSLPGMGSPDLLGVETAQGSSANFDHCLKRESKLHVDRFQLSAEDAIAKMVLLLSPRLIRLPIAPAPFCELSLCFLLPVCPTRSCPSRKHPRHAVAAGDGTSHFGPQNRILQPVRGEGYEPVPCEQSQCRNVPFVYPFLCVNAPTLYRRHRWCTSVSPAPFSTPYPPAPMVHAYQFCPFPSVLIRRHRWCTSIRSAPFHYYSSAGTDGA